jgi:hypothetical protein
MLPLDDMAGGIFTISNGGVFGSLLSMPIINPPQSAILGMHATKLHAVVDLVTGEIVAHPMMYLVLTHTAAQIHFSSWMVTQDILPYSMILYCHCDCLSSGHMTLASGHNMTNLLHNMAPFLTSLLVHTYMILEFGLLAKSIICSLPFPVCVIIHDIV